MKDQPVKIVLNCPRTHAITYTYQVLMAKEQESVSLHLIWRRNLRANKKAKVPLSNPSDHFPRICVSHFIKVRSFTILLIPILFLPTLFLTKLMFQFKILRVIDLSTFWPFIP